MLRAALKHDVALTRPRRNEVPTHIMLRAALKLLTGIGAVTTFTVPTHIMPRAALKLLGQVKIIEIALGPDTYNAACGIETLQLAPEPTGLHVPTHIMPRAALNPFSPKWRTPNSMSRHT